MSSYLNQFNYQLVGPEQGRKWCFLHGLMGYGRNWRRIASELATTERVLTFDQRGHGKSMKPLTGYAPEDYAEDLYLILQDLGWDKIILVGHSLGGRNALMFAAKFPEKLEKLVIVDIGPDSKIQLPSFYQRLLESIPTPFSSKQEAKFFLLNKLEPPTLGAYLYSNIEDLPDGRADWRFSKEAMIMSIQQGRAHDHWKEFRQLSIPTLIIRGELSKDLSVDEFQRMLAENSNVQGVQIPNAGHWVHSEQPQAFIKVLKEFTGVS